MLIDLELFLHEIGRIVLGLDVYFFCAYSSYVDIFEDKHWRCLNSR